MVSNVSLDTFSTFHLSNIKTNIYVKVVSLKLFNSWCKLHIDVCFVLIQSPQNKAF